MTAKPATRGATLRRGIVFLACSPSLAGLLACGPRDSEGNPRTPTRFYGNMPLVVDPAALDTGAVPFHFAAHHIASDDNLLALPDDYLTVFSALTSAPLAVAETGYQAVTTSGEVGGRCIPGLPSSEADQRWWMRRLLADAKRASMPFVVWWANEDLMPTSVLLPCECQDTSEWCSFLRRLDRDGRTGIRFFGTMGLRDFDGTPRPALADWRAAAGR